MYCKNSVQFHSQSIAILIACQFLSPLLIPESQDTDLGLQEARCKTKQEADILNFLASSAPDLLAPRLLAFDPDPNNPIQAPFIIEARLRGQNLLQLSCTDSFAVFDWVSGLNGVCLLLRLIAERTIVVVLDRIYSCITLGV